MRTRISAWLLVLTLAGVPYSAPTQETKPQGLDSRSLTEVRWLTELPPGLAAAVGRKDGRRDHSLPCLFQRGDLDFNLHTRI
jgi:hypothetical protein